MGAFRVALYLVIIFDCLVFTRSVDITITGIDSNVTALFQSGKVSSTGAQVLTPPQVQLLYFWESGTSYSLGLASSAKGQVGLTWSVNEPVSLQVNQSSFSTYHSQAAQAPPAGFSILQFCIQTTSACTTYWVYVPLSHLQSTAPPSDPCDCSQHSPTVTLRWVAEGNLTVLLQPWPTSCVDGGSGEAVRREYQLELRKEAVTSGVNLIRPGQTNQRQGIHIERTVNATRRAPHTFFDLPADGSTPAKVNGFFLKITSLEDGRVCSGSSFTIDMSKIGEAAGGGVIIEVAKPSPRDATMLPIILGSTIGGVVFLLMIVASCFAWVFYKRRRRNLEYGPTGRGDHCDDLLLGNLDKTSQPNVLLVYSWDSAAHSACVSELSSYMGTSLRCKVSCDMTASPQEVEECGGLAQWYSARLASADYVVTVCSAGVRFKSSSSYRAASKQDYYTKPELDSFATASAALARRPTDLAFKMAVVLFEYSSCSDIPPSMDSWVRFTLPRDRKAFSVYFAAEEAYNAPPCTPRPPPGKLAAFFSRRSSSAPRTASGDDDVVTSTAIPLELRALTAKVNEAQTFIQENPGWLHAHLNPDPPTPQETPPSSSVAPTEGHQKEGRGGSSPSQKVDEGDDALLRLSPPPASLEVVPTSSSEERLHRRRPASESPRSLPRRRPNHLSGVTPMVESKRAKMSVGMTLPSSSRSASQQPMGSYVGSSSGRRWHTGVFSLSRRMLGYDDESANGSVSSAGGEDLESDVNFIKSLDSSDSGSSVASRVNGFSDKRQLGLGWVNSGWLLAPGGGTRSVTLESQTLLPISTPTADDELVAPLLVPSSTSCLSGADGKAASCESSADSSLNIGHVEQAAEQANTSPLL